MISFPKSNRTIKFLIALLFSLLSLSIVKSEYIPPEEILDRMTLSIYGLSSYRCKVKINANVIDFGISVSLNGTVYFKEPNKLALKLEDLPLDIQDKYKISFTQTAVPGMVSKTYKEKYKAKFVGVKNFTGNRKVYVLHMEPYKKSSVQSVLMFVDSQNYTIPRAIIFYRDGGKVTIDQVYSRIQEYYLPSKQEVFFDFSKVRANLVSEFYDYEINIPVEDSIFENKK
ncbi:MAG: hypothetical protein ABDH21_00545 [bacterium]